MVSQPMIGVVVVNYFGGDRTIGCLESLEKLTWPRDRLVVCLVDNGSEPGWPALVQERFPALRLVQTGRNLGFGGACNRGFEALTDCDHIALLNNDAVPDPGWLEPLVAALEDDPRCGAATPKVLLDHRYLVVELRSPTTRPGGTDPRTLGVSLRCVDLDGVDVTDDVELVDGFWGWERGPAGASAWTSGEATALVPVPTPATGTPEQLRIEVAAISPRDVRLTVGRATVSGNADAVPTWLELADPAPTVDVINNAGSVLLASGATADRGYLRPDDGSFDEAIEVFGWSAAAVLLSRRYVDDLGGFDERYFLYSEDADLAWRGRLRRWTYRYVPESVVRHEHSATTGSRSAMTRHLAARNRLVLLTTCAPRAMLVPALRRVGADLASAVARDVLLRLANRRRPVTEHVRVQARVALAFLRMVPASLRARRRLRPDRRRDEVLAWAQPG